MDLAKRVSLQPRLLRYASLTLQTLSQNSAHKHASDYALSIYGKDAVFTFIPKNACSTMRYTIALANGAISGPEEFNWIHANNTTFRASLAELAKAKYTFVILRDPYLRIGSCFLDKIVDSTPVAWAYRDLTNYKADLSTLTFREFISNLELLLHENEHWRPQIDFLIYRDYDEYFSVENFAQATKTLRDRLGLEVQDARNLTKHGSDQFKPIESNEGFADRPVYEIAAMKRAGAIPRIEQLYDTPLIDRVRAIYGADIELYEKYTRNKCIF